MDDTLPQGFTLDDQPSPAPGSQQQQQPISDPSSPAPLPAGFQLDDEKYSTPRQQLLLGAEKLGKGFAGPLATGVEKALSDSGVPGLTPEDQEAREQANPTLSPVLEGAGLIAGDLTGIGEIGLLGKVAGEANKAVELGKAGSHALRGAIEMAGLSAGDEASKIINDPDAASGMSLAHIGLSTALGALGGGIFGTIAPKWLADSAPEVEQGIQDFKNSVSGDVLDQSAKEPVDSVFSGLSKQKDNAKEILDIGQRNNWPVLEGMTSDSKEIQMGEDALLNGPPTIASISRRKAYQDAFDAADDAIDSATKSTTNASETETGNALKKSFLDKLNGWYAPIKSLYSEIEPYRQAIPLADRSTGTLSRTIEKIIEDQGLVPGSERYNFVKTFADGIGNVDNLQKLSNFRTEVSRSSGPLTKDLAGIISDKLSGVEDRAIQRFAGTMKTGPARDKILSLIDTSNAAKSQYANFKGMLQDLGNSLGKKKVYGPQNFMDFIEDLNPQTLARRSFNENNTEFASYLAKNFPDEMGIIRDYQRGVMRDAATKEGILSSKKLTKNILDLPPEMQKLLYSDAERGTISDANKYLASMPKSFNPSGTAHESAFRAFFEHPTGAIIANLRDFGIQSLIKSFGKAVPGAEKEAATLIPMLGPKLMDAETNPRAFKTSVQMAMSTIKAAKALSLGAANLFTGDLTKSSDNDDTAKLDEKLEDLSQNPQKMLNMAGELGHYAPDHAQAMSKVTMNAVNYLNSQRPKTIQPSPLDTKIEPSPAEKYAFERKLQIAQNPLSILNHIKNGTLVPQDMQTLSNVNPAYYQKMQEALTHAMTDHLSKDGTVPYKLRQPLSLFLSQPLDSTMTPQSIQAIQAVYAPKQQGPASPPVTKNKRNTSKLGKISETMQTRDQSAESRRMQD